MPARMNSAPSTSQGFGSPTLVMSDHLHDQHANQTPLRRKEGEHGKINRNEYDHSKTVMTSKHIISSACLQSVNSTPPTYVQVTEDSNCEASGYVCSHFEDFKETKPFCSLTEEFKALKESLLRKRDEELHGLTDYESFSEDYEEFGDFCPLLDKKEKSRDIHYHNPAPGEWQESEYLDSLCENERKHTKISFWIIHIFTNLFFFKWSMQRSKHVQEEVAHRYKSLHKCNHDENVTPSILDTRKSTYRPMPPPSVGRKDNIPFESSGVHVLVYNTLSLIGLISRAVRKTCILVVILLLFISQTIGEVSDVPLDCTSKMHLTSPNYPSDYPSDANMKWQVTAPSGRWILVKFNDFNVEEEIDFLLLLDINIRNTVRYTGERTRIPSFLTQGNALEATFASFGYRERRGFNITVSCYETSDTSGGRLVGGNTPAEGFLHLLSQSGQRFGVCEDNLSATVAEVICGELGYPGVKEISYNIDGCQSDVNDQTCVRAPTCDDDTYVLEDCSFTTGNCTTFSSVKIKCYEPGFKGCYGFDIDELQNVSTHDSTSKCISSCRGKASHDIAVFDGEKCFCSNSTEVNLLYRKPAQNQTTCPRPVKNNQQIVNALVYNVSVGFCNQTDDVINGTWDSNITWFGSIVHLTCDDGYSINGNGALQCVPGISSYYPVWNDSMPTCDRFEDGPGEDATRGIPTPYIILICIIAAILFIFICIVLVIEKKTSRYKLRARTYRHSCKAHRISTEENGQRTYSRRGHIYRRSGTGPNVSAEICLLTPTHFYLDSEWQNDLFRTRNHHIQSSEPSETAITPFPSFNHTNERTKNHYHDYDTQEDSHSYFSVMDSGVSNRDHTEQNRHRHIGTSQNTYKLRNFRDTRKCRTEMKSMSDRPLPQRPISCGIQEGPCLPRRGQSTSSSCGSSYMTEFNKHPSDYNLGASATDKEGPSAIFWSHLGIHGNSFTDDKVQKLRDGESTKQVVDLNPCPVATSRPTTRHNYYHDYSVREKEDKYIIPPQSTRPDPFYHCLENDQQMYSDKDELMESEDRDDNPSGMTDNILYNMNM